MYIKIQKHCVMWPSAASVGVQQTSVYYCTGNKKMPFSYIRSSIVPEWKLSNFGVETPSK